MARYRKIDVRIWADREFRRLSRPQPNGQSLWLYLLTGRETAIIPGAFAARESGLAEELRWPVKGFREAFAEVSGEAFAEGCSTGAEKPLAKADWDAGFVWVPNAIKHNPPQSPNVVRSWRDTWDELPECDLKREAYEGLRAFVEGMGEAFAEAFAEAIPKPSWKPCRKPMANQEQEQEQEEENAEPEGLGAILVSPVAKLGRRSHEREAVEDGRVRTIGEYYRSKIPVGNGWSLSAKYNKRVRAVAVLGRLNDGYSVEDICKAIDGYAASDWHRSNGEDDLELIVRNVDKGMKMAAAMNGPAQTAPYHQRIGDV